MQKIRFRLKSTRKYLLKKKGLVPSTKWKKQVLSNLGILETVITGIGQGYIQTTPLQLCLMTAQLANGGFKIKPNIIYNIILIMKKFYQKSI